MRLPSFIVVLCTAALLLPSARAAGFVDVLARPATMSPLAAKGLLSGVARAGDRLVAVGPRGHVVVSVDGGATWRQSAVPVSADLTAVHFADANHGWAVGHDGVVLATRDGGTTWELQLDGKRANDLVLSDIERKAVADPDAPALRALLAEAQRNVKQGADKPFLDVWFADAKTGYVVGAYNLIFKTEDGGTTWLPWFDRTDNPKFLNLYAVRPAAGGLFVAGEAGLLLALDGPTKRFRAIDVPYQGTLFGVLGDAGTLVVYGLRGTVLHSDNGGRSFTRVDAKLPATITAGVVLPDGVLALADVSGRVATSPDGGRSWQPLPLPGAMMVTGLAATAGGKLALVGSRGPAVAGLGPRPHPSR